jgi:hypothetical protein
MAYSKKSSRGGKEVATHHANRASVEETFGSAPPEIAVGGGTMCTFGYRPRDGGVWPTATSTVNVKTGYPQGYDKPTKSPRP